MYKSKTAPTFTLLLMQYCLNISTFILLVGFCPSKDFLILNYYIPWTVVIHLQDAPVKQYKAMVLKKINQQETF